MNYIDRKDYKGPSRCVTTKVERMSPELKTINIIVDKDIDKRVINGTLFDKYSRLERIDYISKQSLMELYNVFKGNGGNLAEVHMTEIMQKLHQQKPEFRAVVIALMADHIKEEGFVEWLEKMLNNIPGLQIVYVTCKSKIEQTLLRRFNINHIGSVWGIEFDYINYISECWRVLFGGGLIMDAEIIFRGMMSFEEVNCDNIDKILLILKDRAKQSNPDEIPTKKDIDELLYIDKSAIAWKDKMHQMIGLEDVKQQLIEILMTMLYDQKRNELYKDCRIQPVRMAISGNPGTGKSMIILLIAYALQQEGFLKGRNYHYVSARDMIKTHVGETEQYIKEIFEKYPLIIIDEIGGLTEVKDEFTNSLIQNMVFYLENSPNVHVIFAGYQNDVENFLQKNPGLRSRTKNFIHIGDYDERTLVNICISMLMKEQYTFELEKIEPLITSFVEIVCKQEDFGNARCMRNLVDEVIVCKAFEYDRTKVIDSVLSEDIVQKAIGRYFDKQFKPKEEKIMLGFVAKV